MKKSRRVVITGLGVVAPNGIGKDAFWQNLVAGKSAVDWITAFDPTPYPCRVAAEVRNFNPTDFMHIRRTKHRGRFSQFAVAAAKLALRDSGLNLSAERPDRIAACVGTALGGLGDLGETVRWGLNQPGATGIPPLTGIEIAAHAPVSHVSVELGLRGQAMTIASACSTGLDVIQWARSQIEQGQADLAFAGSTDAPIFETCFAPLCALKVLSRFENPPKKACRPYDLNRDGLVIGEGSAICVLEDLDHALERKTNIYAEIVGFGSGNEGGYNTKTDASELALTEAIRSALAEADLSSSSLDHINAHGNALPDYDLIETRAFKRALGGAAYNIPINSIKSMIGHAMGAAATIQVVSACLTLQHSIIPPTINYETPDPDCDLDYVPNKARTSRVRTVLINAHAMGGTHSVLVLRA